MQFDLKDQLHLNVEICVNGDVYQYDCHLNVEVCINGDVYQRGCHYEDDDIIGDATDHDNDYEGEVGGDSDDDDNADNEDDDDDDDDDDNVDDDDDEQTEYQRSNTLWACPLKLIFN